MSRTAKWEHKTDSFHIGHRLERQARPAGRLLQIIDAELADAYSPAMDDGPEFVLDRTENPHPRMRDHALQLRRTARVSGDHVIAAQWLGYLEAMCDATGESSEAINGWLDRFDSPSIAEEIRTGVPVPGPSRRR